MANEIRSRFNLVSGSLTSGISNSDTTISSAGLANLGVIDSTNYAPIIIGTEIIWVTAHSAAATTATVVRAKEGTSAVSHAANATWVHGPTVQDMPPEIWTAYTPALTVQTLGTNPMLGSGATDSGRSIRIGGLATVLIDIVFGSGMTPGSGSYEISLPVAIKSPLAFSVIGQVLMSHSGSSAFGLAVPGGAGGNVANKIQIKYPGGSPSGADTNVTNAAPWTWAAGDAIRALLTYETV